MRWIYLLAAFLWTMPVERIVVGKHADFAAALIVMALAWCSGLLFGREAYKPHQEGGGE